MEKVAELLARKHPQFNTVSIACLVSDALYQMCCEHLDYLVILRDDNFKGIITPDDIAAKILFENRPLNTITVEEFMNATLPVEAPDASLQACMQTMELFNVRHVAIFDSVQFIGVVSAYDLMQEAMNRPQSYFLEKEPPRPGYPWSY